MWTQFKFSVNLISTVPRLIWLGIKYYVLFAYYCIFGKNDFIEDYEKLVNIKKEMLAIKFKLALNTALNMVTSKIKK